MPKLPDKTKLGSAPNFNSGRAIVSSGDVDGSAAARGLQAFAAGIGNVGAVLKARSEREQKEQDALDLIKADAALKRGLITTERAFEDDPDYGTYEPRFREKASSLIQGVTQGIRNPAAREKFAAKASVDTLRTETRIASRGRQLEKQQRQTEVEDILRGYRKLYVDPSTDEARRDQVLLDIESSIALAQRGGILTPQQARRYREDYYRKTVLEEAKQRLLRDPEGLKRDLNREVFARQQGSTTVDDSPEIQQRLGERQPVRRFSAPVNDAINAAAEKHGVDPGLLSTFAQIESSGRPGVQTGSYKGLFQLSDAEFEKHGGEGDIFDPVANADAAAQKFNADSAAFQQKYGRAPTLLDLYMVHQQGEAGYAAHMGNPDAPAWENMASTGEGKAKGIGWAKRAIWGNIPDDAKAQFPDGVESVTSRQFFDIWNNKIARFSGQQTADAGGVATDAAYPEAAQPVGRYGLLTYSERADLYRKAEKQFQVNEQALREQLKRSLDDDVESIRRTGVGREGLDLDTAQRVLEPNQINTYRLNRQKAELEFNALRDITQLPEDGLQRRLDDLEPKPGEAGYAIKSDLFDKVRREVDQVREQRRSDPARAVDSLPDVAEVAAAAREAPDDADAVQALVRARLDAQEKVGIPEQVRRPVTRAEAKALISRLDGLEGKELREAMMAFREELETKYGPYARSVAQSAIEMKVADRTIAEEIETQITRAFRGLEPRGSDTRRLELLSEIQLSQQAFGGDRDMARFFQRFGGVPVDGIDRPGQGTMYLPPQTPPPPRAAIEALRANPSLAREFERKYGRSAQDYLDPMSPRNQRERLGAVKSEIDRLAAEAAKTKGDPYNGLLGQSWQMLTPAESVEDARSRLREARNALEAARRPLPPGHPMTRMGRFGTEAFQQEQAAAVARARKDLETAEMMLSGQLPKATKTMLRSSIENASREAANVVLSVPQFVGIVSGYATEAAGAGRVDDNALLIWAKSAKEYVAERFPGDAARQADLSQQFAAGLGSMVSFYGTGFLTAIARLGRRATMAALATLGAATGGSQGFDEGTEKMKESERDEALRILRQMRADEAERRKGQ